MRARLPTRPTLLLTTLLLTTLLLAAGCGGPGAEESKRPDYAGEAGAYASPSGSREAPPLRFTDVTERAGIHFVHENGAFGRKWMPETMGSGAGFLDYDGDGLPDLLLVSSAEWPGHETRPAPARSALYRNRGNGTFEEVSEETGIGPLTAGVYGMGATFADYDGDGDPDIYVTAVGDNLLLRNEGGRFRDVTDAAGVPGNPPATEDPPAPPAWSTAAAWLDADRDGRLDLFVCNYVRWTPETDLFTTLDGDRKSYATPEQYEGESCRLYRNRDGRRFEDATEESGLLRPAGKSLGVVVTDFDDDGWPDIFVANDTQPNFLYLNDGDGTFTDVALEAGVAFDERGRARAGMGVDVSRVTGGDRISVAVGNFSHEPVSLFTEIGPGVFQDLAGSAGLTRPTLRPLTFGLVFADLDLDGFEDLVLANGHIEPGIGRVQEGIRFAQAPSLFHNTGEGRFVDATGAAGEGFARPAVGRGLAVSDYDRDGDPDLLLTTNGGPPRLLRNDVPETTRGRWLRLRLRGRAPNPGAVGAAVTVWAGNRGLRDRVRTGASYLSQSEANPLLFGLGRHDRADSVRVRWPASGHRTTTGPLASGREHTIREPAGERP